MEEHVILSKKELDELVNWCPTTIKVGDVEVEIEDDNEYGSLVEKLLQDGKYIYLYQMLDGKYKDTKLPLWNGLEYDVVHVGDFYDGHETEHVVRFGETYVMFKGYYSSWNSSKYAEEYYQVYPEEKVVTITEWKKV